MTTANFIEIYLVVSKKLRNFAAANREAEFYWKVGRVIDRAGLEIRYTPFGYRGFESLTFRKKYTKGTIPFVYFFFFGCYRLSNEGLASLLSTVGITGYLDDYAMLRRTETCSLQGVVVDRQHRAVNRGGADSR